MRKEPIIKIVIMLFIIATHLHAHEYVHQAACDYAGGKGEILSLTSTMCSISDNPYPKEMYVLDVVNEIVTAITVPTLLLVGSIWVTKEEK